MKRCSRCKVEKSCDAFNRNRRTKDGRQSQCRECVSAYMREYTKRPEVRHRNARRVGRAGWGGKAHRPRSMTDAREAFDWYVDNGIIDTSGDCWLWRGARIDGYGQLTWQQQRVLAHRFVFETLTGEDAGEHLHHECRVRNCVRPEHLTPMTEAEHAALHAAEGDPLELAV